MLMPLPYLCSHCSAIPASEGADSRLRSGEALGPTGAKNTHAQKRGVGVPTISCDGLDKQRRAEYSDRSEHTLTATSLFQDTAELQYLFV